MNLIDKDALVAEIERRIKNTNNDVKIGAIESLTVSKTLNSLISFIKTLEVKESKLPNPRKENKMKANEVPEKIYINSNLENRTWLIGKGDTSFIEYTRTDAFIKNVCEWIKKRCLGYEEDFIEMLIEDLKNYLKGE